MAKAVSRTLDEPHDRLTRLAGAMSAALEAHPEHRDGDQFIILVDGEREDGKHGGGMTASGFKDAAEILASLMGHTEAFAEAHGLELRYVPVEPNQG